MQSKQVKFAQIAMGVMALATVFALPAAAEAHHPRWHHHWHQRYAYDRPLTVHGHRHPVVVAAPPDPYSGPNVIVTGPNAVAATIVSLPFRAVNSIFPPTGDTPLVVIGAPAYAAAHVAEFPFYVVGTAFGAPPNVAY
jgi:hypothetical protein